MPIRVLGNYSILHPAYPQRPMREVPNYHCLQVLTHLPPETISILPFLLTPLQYR